MKRESFAHALVLSWCQQDVPSVLETCGSFRISAGHMEARLYPDLLMFSGYSRYSGSGSRICGRTGKPHKCCEMF